MRKRKRQFRIGWARQKNKNNGARPSQKKKEKTLVTPRQRAKTTIGTSDKNNGARPSQKK
jgi:hypothetical protein